MAANAQGKFWEMHDLLFLDTKKLDRDSLIDYAKRIGLDVARFTQELDSGKYAERVKQDMAEGQRAGVRGTPTIFFNGRKFEGSNRTLEGFEKVLAAELGLKL